MVNPRDNPNFETISPPRHYFKAIYNRWRYGLVDLLRGQREDPQAGFEQVVEEYGHTSIILINNGNHGDLRRVEDIPFLRIA